jgi:uncharacterized protein (TIGR01777 family)
MLRWGRVEPLSNFAEWGFMRVFITGGTGMIGRRLVRRLSDRGDVPVILSRKSDETRRVPSLRGIEVIQGDPSKEGHWQDSVDGCDAVCNLAGQNVFGKRWDAETKRQIRDSRVYGAEHVVAAIAKASQKPRVLVQGSAIGYYGNHDDDELTESSPSGSDFLAVVCRELEEAAAQVEPLGVRLATIRTGVVLAREEGALALMAPIFKLGGATPIGNGGHALRPARGRQWMSWIHADDILGIFLMALDNPDARGPINGTAPNPARNFDFSKALAKVLHRPFIPFGPPDLAVEVILGEVAKVITKGQRVLPSRAQQLGYRFAYPELAGALAAVFAKDNVDPDPKPVEAGSH